MILPQKRDLDLEKAKERKREIDNGLIMARQIDGLRETLSELKLRHANFLKASKEELESTLTGLDEGIVAKRKELVEIEKERMKLLEPLTEQSDEIKHQGEKLQEDKNEFFLEKERFQQSLKIFEGEREELDQMIRKVSTQENEVRKLQTEVLELQEMAQTEYDIANEERLDQNNKARKKSVQLNQRITEYDVALKTIEIREQQVKDKELELIIREKDLARRLGNLQRVEGLQ